MIKSHRPITSTMFLRLNGNGFSEFQLYQRRKIPALPPQELFNPLAISDQSWQDSRYLRDPELCGKISRGRERTIKVSVLIESMEESGDEGQRKGFAVPKNNEGKKIIVF